MLSFLSSLLPPFLAFGLLWLYVQTIRDILKAPFNQSTTVLLILMVLMFSFLGIGIYYLIKPSLLEKRR